MPSIDTTFRVALLGYGTVGSAIHVLLEQHAQHIRHATGRSVSVTGALVRDVRARGRIADAAGAGGSGEGLRFFDDADALLDEGVDLVCEALGGLEPARTYVLAALSRGIPVVTANKQLVANHGAELFDAAERHGAQLRFEASVCAAIPVVRMLRESLAAARIDRVLGILNGTTNFVLSSMDQSGASYGDALAVAQQLGYAEPDPTDDVTGIDAAAKLAILAGIAFHTRVPLDAVATTGITDVSAEDIAFARQLGCRIKLVGRAERTPAGLRLDVTPMLVPERHPLAAVSGATNAVQLTGATFDELTLQGPGAGGPQTASAIAGDIVGVMGSHPSFLTRDPGTRPFEPARGDAVPEPHFIRMRVPDRPGVLASVAGRFAAKDVSIERVIQQRSPDGSGATLVLTTHPAPRQAVHAALSQRQDESATADDAGTGAGECSIMPMLEEGSSQ